MLVTPEDRIKAALESGDLAAISDLLTPDVAWGPPDDSKSGCHNREQVLTWWGRSQKVGASAKVTAMERSKGRLLVGLEVKASPTGPDSEPSERWQVLGLRDGLICDIRGFANKDEALAYLS